MRKSEWELLRSLICELCSLILSFIRTLSHHSLFVCSVPGTQARAGNRKFNKSISVRVPHVLRLWAQGAFTVGGFLSPQRYEQEPWWPSVGWGPGHPLLGETLSWVPKGRLACRGPPVPLEELDLEPRFSNSWGIFKSFVPPWSPEQRHPAG